MRKRFAVYDRQLEPLFDMDVNAMVGEGAVRTEKLKGEHKLDVTTTQRLEEGMRVLSRDGTLKMREWVIDEPDETHGEDGMLFTYGCTWSMQYDLSTVDGGELWPGTYTPIGARAALAMVLAPQTTWEVGEVTVGGTAGTTLYDGSVWDYLGTLQETWGGEMEPRVEVGMDGKIHRYVDWLAHVGNPIATRRFDFGEDCTSIRRKVAPGPRYCRVVPRGGRDAQDADGIRYSDRCGVEEEPYRAEGDFVHDANSKYVRDTVAEQLFRTKDADDEWRYPEKVVCYDLDLQGDQEELLNKAMADIADHTRPKTTYEADVLQFAAAGLDPHGVALGDEVQIVDRAFGDVPLRLQARIVEMTVNELDETDVKLVIGEANANLSSSFKSLTRSIDAAEGRAREIQAGGTIAYVEGLLDAINKRIAADGGYTYMVNGQGTITYDKAVSDPLVGAEATQVVQMKGGTLRFANSRKPGFQGIDDWKWQTVITSNGFLGLAATIGALTSGYIKDYNEKNTWDLDSGILTTTKGYIGGFEIGATSIHTRNVAVTSNADNSIALSSADFTRTINGTSRGGLRFAIGYRMGVTGDGTIYAANANISGTVYASAGEIGGFVIDSNSIHSSGHASSSTDSGAVWLSSSTFTRTIDGTSRSSLKLAIGGSFAVSSSGYLYASNAVISGTITASSGEIGGFTITSNSLYNGKSSLQSLTSGVYISTSGISVGSGTAYTALASGYLYGGGSSGSTHGYVGFNNYWTSTGIYGARLAGRGCIALLTNGAFGIGSYYNFGSDATITVGQTKSVTYVTGGIGYDGSPSVTVSPTYRTEQWVMWDGSQNVHYTSAVSLMSGVSVSITLPTLKWSTDTIGFTKGLMTTS